MQLFKIYKKEITSRVMYFDIDLYLLCKLTSLHITFPNSQKDSLRTLLGENTPLDDALIKIFWCVDTHGDVMLEILHLHPPS